MIYNTVSWIENSLEKGINELAGANSSSQTY